jgi:hypothetical protein
MALSQVDVCNLALSRIGGHGISQITSLGEASTEARQCAVKFPYVLASALRAYPWHFATKEIVLALLGCGAAEHFLENDIFYRNLHYYQYPEECMRILALNPAAGKKGNHFAPAYDYTVERISDGTKAIVTPCPQAVLTCTSYSEDPSIWDSLFTDAFAWQLAGELCISFGGALDTVRTLREIADRSFEKAKSRDCGEEAADIYCSKYLEARK